MPDIDITKNIRIIEKLKSEILSGVAELYDSMLMPSRREDNRAEIYADIIIKAYELAKRTGIDYDILDNAIINKLRLSAIEDGMEASDSARLLRHLNRERE